MSEANIKIPRELADEIDNFISGTSFRNRTEFTIYQIRKTLDQNKPNSINTKISEGV